MEGSEIPRILLRKKKSPLHDPCVLHRKLEYPIPRMLKSMAVPRIPRTNQIPRSGNGYEGPSQSLDSSRLPKTIGLETNLKNEMDKSNQEKNHRSFANTMTTTVSSEDSRLPNGFQVSHKNPLKHELKTTNGLEGRFSVESAESLKSTQRSGERVRRIKGEGPTSGESRRNGPKESQLQTRSYSSEAPQTSGSISEGPFPTLQPTDRSQPRSVVESLRVLDKQIPRDFFVETEEEERNDNVFSSDTEMFFPRRSQRTLMTAPWTKRVENSSEEDTLSIKNQPNKGKTKERSRGRRNRCELDNSKKIGTKQYIPNFVEIKDRLPVREIKAETAETDTLDTSEEGQTALWKKEEGLTASGNTSEDLEDPSFPISNTLDEAELYESLGELLPKKVVWYKTEFPDSSQNITSLTPRSARLTVHRRGVPPVFCNQEVTFWTSMDLKGDILLHCSREEKEIFRLLLNEETVTKYGVKSKIYTIFFTAANEGEHSVQVDIQMADKQSFDNSVWTIDNLCRQKQFKIERGGRSQ
ncbi:unnamed protein product [Bursaphelenchus xylophilus]|uniref:(pine wood nematode) hypothetical protein n=1 Tax=Bursaphelenchus xylophilus TaxID=6326 RepID=A0A1I7SLR4_BURXY|nr:unnamed protein product [Bursaphelenchus xylophilus]CAG9129710.1 unnamed protein product [Bursaphelenchus xylophilus]